ncbi:MAG: Leptospira phage [Bacteroidota bacterium]|jgi:acid stress-induced BolA-like protein IbaG/YrbA
MKLTNRHNLPETIINVLRRPQYSKGGAHVSATELLSSPRIVQLRRQHWNDIEEDASEMVWSLFGSALHNVLEHGKDRNHVVEERLFAEVDGWSLSGAVDLQEFFDDGIVISDYKVTSVWSVMNDKLDWHRQLNVYAWLIETIKHRPIKSLQIVAILRDWNRRDAEQKQDYPSAPIVVVPIPLWPIEAREEYIRKRIHLHAEAMFQSEVGGDLPECSSEEMWEKPTTFAIKKKGNKRANFVFVEEDKANAKVQEMGEAYVIERRPGERTRCEKFCTVSPWCNQYQLYKESMNVSAQEADESASEATVA